MMNLSLAKAYHVPPVKRTQADRNTDRRRALELLRLIDRLQGIKDTPRGFDIDELEFLNGEILDAEAELEEIKARL